MKKVIIKGNEMFYRGYKIVIMLEHNKLNTVPGTKMFPGFCIIDRLGNKNDSIIYNSIEGAVEEIEKIANERNRIW